MKGKRLRIASLVVLLGLIAAIPASTQVLFGSSGDDTEGGNLPLIILVNRMELTAEQMSEIHGLLEGLLEEREGLEIRRSELEREMIAFNGTSEELDEILDRFRAETREQIEAAREHAQDTIDRIKGILTLKQGEILQEFLPGLLADSAALSSQSRGRGAILGQRGGGFQAPFGPQDEDFELGLRERVFERLEERFADNPEMIARLQRRLGGSTASGPLSRTAQRGGFGMRFAGQAQGAQHRGVDWIEQLLEVLELKLEAIG